MVAPLTSSKSENAFDSYVNTALRLHDQAEVFAMAEFDALKKGEAVTQARINHASLLNKEAKRLAGEALQKAQAHLTRLPNGDVYTGKIVQKIVEVSLETSARYEEYVRDKFQTIAYKRHATVEDREENIYLMKLNETLVSNDCAALEGLLDLLKKADCPASTNLSLLPQLYEHLFGTIKRTNALFCSFAKTQSSKFLADKALKKEDFEDASALFWLRNCCLQSFLLPLKCMNELFKQETTMLAVKRQALEIIIEEQRKIDALVNDLAQEILQSQFKLEANVSTLTEKMKYIDHLQDLLKRLFGDTKTHLQF